ncbi:MAG TPA: hypothetical protein VFU90_14435 [Candidatus Tumulicola sp.]|nr:hypothetical protein [Candidatus Tumulicola sp.]
MKRTLPVIVAALLVLSLSAGARAKLGQGFGVNIQSCVVNNNGGKTNGINVVYSNLNASAATEVDFLVKYHKQRGVFADRGSFAQHALINHNLTNALVGIEWNGPKPTLCKVQRVVLADGTIVTPSP